MDFESCIIFENGEDLTQLRHWMKLTSSFCSSICQFVFITNTMPILGLTTSLHHQESFHLDRSSSLECNGKLQNFTSNEGTMVQTKKPN